jgi:hypothetical protein
MCSIANDGGTSPLSRLESAFTFSIDSFPTQIVRSIEKVGKDRTIKKIVKALVEGGFKLLKDCTIDDLSQRRSIAEAADFMNWADFNFQTLTNQSSSSFISRNMWGVVSSSLQKCPTIANKRQQLS